MPTAEPIRLLHFSDLHVGMENYGRIDPATGTSSRVRDFLDRLDEVIDFALEHEADIAVFAGDAFKSRDPNTTQQREFAQRIKRLADAVPTFLLVGNHDMPGMATKASSVDIFRALDVPGVIVGHRPEGTVVKTRRGPLYLAWMPYPMRNRLLAREEHQGLSIEELQTALRETVANILEGLAAQAAEHDMPRVLVGHFSVEGAHYGSERSVMLGKDVTVSASSLADERWDYVALGHIHSHQIVNQDSYPPVVYSGSLERIDFGEEKEEKGFCWVSLVRQATEVRFEQVAARPFKTVRLDVTEHEDPRGALSNVLEGLEADQSVVRLIISLRADQQTLIPEREITAAQDRVYSLTVMREVQSEARARLNGLTPEALTPLELIERYFRTINVAPERIGALLAKAEELLRDPS